MRPTEEELANTLSHREFPSALKKQYHWGVRHHKEAGHSPGQSLGSSVINLGFRHPRKKEGKKERKRKETGGVDDGHRQKKPSLLCCLTDIRCNALQ